MLDVHVSVVFPFAMTPCTMQVSSCFFVSFFGVETSFSSALPFIVLSSHAALIGVRFASFLSYRGHADFTSASMM